MARYSFLSSRTIQALNSLIVGYQNHLVVKPNELLSSVYKPRHLAYYDPDSSPHSLAAKLAEGIIMGHPFFDGNKRTAFLAANEFMRRNGVKAIEFGERDRLNEEKRVEEIGDAFVSLATKDVDYSRLAEYLERASKE